MLDHRQLVSAQLIDFADRSKSNFRFLDPLVLCSEHISDTDEGKKRWVGGLICVWVVEVCVGGAGLWASGGDKQLARVYKLDSLLRKT